MTNGLDMSLMHSLCNARNGEKLKEMDKFATMERLYTTKSKQKEQYETVDLNCKNGRLNSCMAINSSFNCNFNKNVRVKQA